MDPPPDLPEDVGRCWAAINQNAEFFDRAQILTLGRAPGRLDVMGGIANYSGALVLQLLLASATWVAAEPTDGPVIRISSPGTAAQVELPLRALLPRDSPVR